MSYKIGESIANIQINISELQKECAMFDMELVKVINLAKQIKSDSSVLIGEFGGNDESSAGRTNVGSVPRGMSMRPSCGTCRYFNDLAGDGESSSEGECRRRSPKLVLEHEVHYCAWPPVDKIQWCGEYQLDYYS